MGWQGLDRDGLLLDFATLIFLPTEIPEKVSFLITLTRGSAQLPDTVPPEGIDSRWAEALPASVQQNDSEYNDVKQGCPLTIQSLGQGDGHGASSIDGFWHLSKSPGLSSVCSHVYQGSVAAGAEGRFVSPGFSLIAVEMNTVSTGNVPSQGISCRTSASCIHLTNKEL